MDILELNVVDMMDGRSLVYIESDAGLLVVPVTDAMGRGGSRIPVSEVRRARACVAGPLPNDQYITIDLDVVGTHVLH